MRDFSQFEGGMAQMANGKYTYVVNRLGITSNLGPTQPSIPPGRLFEYQPFWHLAEN